MSRKEELEQLFEGNRYFARFHDIVAKTIEEEKLLSEKLLEFEDKNPSFSSKVADKVAI